MFRLLLVVISQVHSENYDKKSELKKIFKNVVCLKRSAYKVSIHKVYLIEEIWLIKKKPINLERAAYTFNPSTLKTVGGRAMRSAWST